MEDSVLIEKVISVYILVLSFIDLYIIWPISFFLISSFCKDESVLNIALWAGGLIFVHSLSKLTGFLLFPTLSRTCSLKLVLLLQLALGSASALLLGIFPSFISVFASRTLSGFSSSFQPAIRRVFVAICLKEKNDWPSFASKLIWTSKLSGFFGILVSGVLSNPALLLSTVNDKSVERWFLLGLILFLLNISALLLVFSIDSENLSQLGKIEVVEKKEEEKEKNDENLNGLDFTSVEKTDDRHVFNFRRFFDEREEKEKAEYFSPKHDANKSSRFSVPLSARVESKARASAETVDESSFSPDVKKTHISIIEDDLPDLSQPDEKHPDIKITDKKEEPSLQLALFYRAFLTFYSAVLYESFPFLIISSDLSVPINELALLVGIPFILSASVKIWASPWILKRVSCIKLSSWCIGSSSFVLLVEAILLALEPNIWYLPFTAFFLFTFCEMMLPLGVILVSDSVKPSERDLVLFRSDVQALFSRIFSGLISCLIIFGLHPASLAVFLMVLALALIIVHKKISGRYRLAGQFPYAL